MSGVRPPSWAGNLACRLGKSPRASASLRRDEICTAKLPWATALGVAGAAPGTEAVRAGAAGRSAAALGLSDKGALAGAAATCGRGAGGGDGGRGGAAAAFAGGEAWAEGGEGTDGAEG